MNPTETQFLNDLDKRLWTAANKLLPMLDAAVYKHVALGLIFLKYVSDAFKERRMELDANFRDPNHDYYLDDDSLIEGELEARDYYTEKNVFWVPPLDRTRLSSRRRSPLRSGCGQDLLRHGAGIVHAQLNKE
jgi:type I restriction enzyme M protein